MIITTGVATTKEDEEFYKNGGMVVYVKGKPLIMIHPNNLENNIELLDNGTLEIGWKLLLELASNGQ